MTIGKQAVTLECSTREVAFIYGHFMNHHRKDFCGDIKKFKYFIVNRHAKDLLKIGIGKPKACYRQKKPKVKVIAKKRSIETAPAFDSNCFVLKYPCFYDSSSE